MKSAWIVGCLLALCTSCNGDDNMVATCDILESSGIPTANIKGTVTFTQPLRGGEVSIEVDVEGFGAAQANTLHGFHVHTNGAMGNQCSDAGGHYNPFNKDHGAPSDTDRHVGDLGNVQVNDNGTMDTTFTDSVISLMGPNTIVGKAIVIHAGVDDLGRGGDEGSRTTGNAGARMGCCIITAQNAVEVEAQCVVDRTSGDPTKTISGMVTLSQMNYGGDVTFDIDLEGFEATEANSLHGFHIHENGDMGDACKNAGGHFNPMGKTHSSRTNTDRHVGDLGNVQVDSTGRVRDSFSVDQVDLSRDSQTSVIGKAIVIHAGEDDLGLGGNDGSLATGNAGARMACCLIELKSQPTGGSVVLYSSLMLTLMAAILAALLCH